jgi:hypothetical protein
MQMMHVFFPSLVCCTAKLAKSAYRLEARLDAYVGFLHDAYMFHTCVNHWFSLICIVRIDHRLQTYNMFMRSLRPMWQRQTEMRPSYSSLQV